MNLKTKGQFAPDRVGRRQKKSNLLLKHLLTIGFRALCILVLLISSQTINAQTFHQRNWVVGDKIFLFSPAAPAQTPPVITHNFPYAVPSSPVNSASDRSGNLFFYIRDFKIFNSSHALIGTFPEHIDNDDLPTFIAQGEVAIVPFIEENGCVKHYYIFYMSMDRTTKKVALRAKIAAVNILSRAVTITDITNIIGAPADLATSDFVYAGVGFGTWLGSGGLAATKEISGKRYLYFVSGNKVQKITITDGTGANHGLSSAVNLNITTPNVHYTTYQAQISDDGTQLAWGSSDSSKTSGGMYINNAKYFIAGLNTTTGNWDNTLKTLQTPTGVGFNKLTNKGVCFNSEGTKLFTTSGLDRYDPLNDNHGIYVFDIATGTNSLIPNSVDYGTSMVTKAANGLIYVRSRNKLCSINPVTNQLVDSIAITPDSILSDFEVRTLPDQINGELSGTDLDLGYKLKITSNTTINNTDGYLPILRIKDTLQISGSGTTLNLVNMTIEFAENAVFILDPGTNMEVISTIFRGLSLPNCPGSNKMWRGIVAHSTSLPIAVHMFGTTHIEDALVGIDAYGTPVQFTMAGFNAKGNEITLKLREGASYLGNTPFAETIFDGTVPLKDQTKGSNFGYADGLKRTTYHVFVDGANIGPSADNTYLGGQYGIYVQNPASASEVFRSVFDGQKQAGLLIKQAKSLQAFNFHGLTFNNQVSGICIRNSQFANFSIYSSTFTNMARYGVDAYNNTGCDFYIGVSRTYRESMDRGNTFTNAAWAAIYLHNNADPVNTDVFIRKNNISASAPGNKGIVISEASGSEGTFSQMRIDYNTISDLGIGYNVGPATPSNAIILTNIIGKNPDYPVRKNLINYPLSHVANNLISLGVLGGNGIDVQASSKHSFFDNTINGNRYSHATRLTNSSNTLYHANTSNTGQGLIGVGSMLNSNYYCNAIQKAYTGMLLRRHKLRSSFTTKHGDAQTGARDNDFSVKPAGSYTNIHLENTFPALNQWKFSGVWGLPVVTSNDPSYNIFGGYEANVCGDPNIPGDGGIDNGAPSEITDAVGIFWERYSRQQSYLQGYDSLPDSNANVVKLLEAENRISWHQDASALTSVNSIVATIGAYDYEIMSDYKKLYQTYLAYRMSDTIGRNMNDSIIAILTTIALKDPSTASPAAHSARAILWDERHLEFGTEPLPALALAGYANTISCTGSVENLPVYLVTENGVVAEGPVYTNTEGQFAFDPGIVTMYNASPDLFKIRMILPDASIIETAAATVNDLALASDHEFDCSNATGPYNINGLVNANSCPGMVTSNIITYLLKDNGDIVEGPLMVGPSGTFLFDPILTAINHNSNLYKIRLIFANATMAETPSATIADLSVASTHLFNCPEEPPIIQGKKGKENGPLLYSASGNEFSQKAPFSVSPNPSSGLFKITGMETKATVSITNLVGQIISKDLPLLNGILDATMLKTGIYLLTITDQHHTYVQKVSIIK